MKQFGLLPKCLRKIFSQVSHFACNSRARRALAISVVRFCNTRLLKRARGLKYTIRRTPPGSGGIATRNVQ